MKKPPTKPGDRFGRLVVESVDPPRRERRATCVCGCGVRKSILLGHLRSERTRSCGCIRIDEDGKPSPGERFGRLVVLESYSILVRGRRHWKCRCDCDCGSQTDSWLGGMRNGQTVSCGCQRDADLSARRTSHGESGTPLYCVWKTMKARCGRPSSPSYPDYGGRGISVCESWKASYEQFRDDVMKAGWKPGLTIDRRDNDGDYEPANIRIVDCIVQCNNRRSSVRLPAFGEEKTPAEWVRDPRCRVCYGTLSTRLRLGWTAERAISEEKRQRGR